MKAILFDLDGVLIDSKSNMEYAWNMVMSRCNVKVPFEKYFAEIGKPFKQILNNIGINENYYEIERVYEHFSSEKLDKINCYEGVIETLKVLKTICKVGIVTSKSKNRTQKLLLKLPDFDWVCCPSKTRRGKPAPDQLLFTLAQLGVNPSSAVYVGDMQTDKECADSAGIKFVHANYGYGKVKCEHSIKEISEVIKLLD